MYDKIAAIMNRDYGAVDISGDEVEAYLRFNDTTMITADEMVQIDDLYDKFL